MRYTIGLEKPRETKRATHGNGWPDAAQTFVQVLARDHFRLLDDDLRLPD